MFSFFKQSGDEKRCCIHHICVPPVIEDTSHPNTPTNACCGNDPTNIKLFECGFTLIGDITHEGLSSPDYLKNENICSTNVFKTDGNLCRIVIFGLSSPTSKNSREWNNGVLTTSATFTTRLVEPNGCSLWYADLTNLWTNHKTWPNDLATHCILGIFRTMIPNWHKVFLADSAIS